MLRSYQIPEFAAYQRAGFELLEIERDIAARQNAKSHRDEKMLARLIVRHAQLRAAVEPLKAAYEAAERRALELMHAPRASFPQHTTPCAEGVGLDIPAFLRRQA